MTSSLRPTGGFLYVLVPRKYTHANHHIWGVYKVGRTQNPEQRFKAYGKGRALMSMLYKDDCFTSEKRLLDTLKNTEDVNKVDEGNELFSGRLDRIQRCLVES